MPLPEHLARHRLGDLFLDTLPCNAHTTASDALWAGLPVLTCMGESFASRVAASVLTAIGLPELITTTQEEYEARAIELALDPEKMRATREKLARNRLTTRLFDTQLFTRNIEAAFEAMYERYQKGLPPDHLVVSLSPLSSMERSVALPSQMEGLSTKEESLKLQRALKLHQEGRLDEAELFCTEILRFKPGYFEVLQLSATIALQRKASEKAVALFDQALAIKPDHARSLNNRGIALQELKCYEEALGSYEKAIAINPEYAMAYSNRGNTLQELKRYEDAVESYDRAIALNPYSATAYSNRGVALLKLVRYEDALESHDRAIVLKPDYADAYYNRSVVLEILMRYEEAIASYEKALLLKPDGCFWYGMYLHTKMKICDWSVFDHQVHQLEKKIVRHEKGVSPFPFLAIKDSLSQQQDVACVFAEKKYSVQEALSPIPKRPRRDTIRIGYFSADFCNHPVSFLTAELFEMHGKARKDLCLRFTNKILHPKWTLLKRC